MNEKLLAEIKQIGITTKDIDLLITGLESIPLAHKGSDLLIEIAHSVLSGEKDDKKIKEKLERKNTSLQESFDDATILKGKLILLKRYLLLAEATEK